MFIKYKFKNTTRKIKKEIKTVEGLKAEAEKVFGTDVVYCDYMYEDEDNELVNIIDDIDLETCFEEAKENGKKCVKVLLELSSPKTKRARSISQKKKTVNFVDEDLEGFGSSDEDEENEIEQELEGFSSDDLEAEIEVEAELSGEEVSPSPENGEKKKEIEEVINKKFNKLEDKMQRKLKKLKEKRHEKLRKIKHKVGAFLGFGGKHRHGKCGRGGKHWKKHGGHGEGMPEFVKNIIEENKKHGFPWKQVKQMFCDAKQEFKTLRGSPELISKAIEKCKDKVVSQIKQSIEEVKAENPELVAELAKKREEREKKVEEKRTAGIERREEKRLHKEKKLQEKMKMIQEKKEKKLREIKEKKEKKEAKKVEEAEKEKSPETKKRQQEVKRRVNIIVPIFTGLQRPEIRKAVVEDLKAGNDVQVTIKRLFEAQEN